MNQHQFPPCRLAILFIRRNVPPRNVDVDANASFCLSAATLADHQQSEVRPPPGDERDQVTHHAPQL
jgi:hypothetical protein